MKAGRLLSILMLLQARGLMSARALAAALEVSERTILRDIDQLSAAGVPLWSERGRAGGFQLRPGWSTQLTGVTEPEANALLLAGLPGPATELGLGAAAASARRKMVASLPAEWRAQAERVGERLHIDPIDWYRAPDTPRFLRDAADAVWSARRIAVRYESWRGVSRRELEPLGLVLKAGAWYVAARTVGKEAVRTYRLASMLKLQVGNKSFRRPRDFDLARHWAESARRFESELRRVPARVLASPRAQKWIANQKLPFTAIAMPADAGPTDRASAGWRELVLPVESIEQGARELLGLGAEVEVLAPAALRAELVRQAQLVLAAYVPPDSAPPVRRRAES